LRFSHPYQAGGINGRGGSLPSGERILKIHLQLHSVLRDKLPTEAKGCTVLHLDEGTTLAGILKMLDIKRKVVISLNDIHQSDHSLEVQDGDEVKIFSAVSGGTDALLLN